MNDCLTNILRTLRVRKGRGRDTRPHLRAQQSLVAVVLAIAVAACGDVNEPLARNPTTTSQAGTTVPTVATGPTSTVPARATVSASTPTVSAPGTPATSSQSGAPATHVVQAGDTVGAICASKVSSMAITDCIDALVRLNNLPSANQLVLGQTLALPAGTASTPNGAPTAATSPAGQATAAVQQTSTAAVPPAGQATTAASGAITIIELRTPVQPGQTATLRATVPRMQLVPSVTSRPRTPKARQRV